MWLSFPMLAVAFVFAAASPAPARAESSLPVVGLIEIVRLLPDDIDIMAKVDTGAQHSSIDVAHWETFERDGSTWVRFTLHRNGVPGHALERPLVRMARVARAGDVQERPVVHMTLCVGDIVKDADVNLAERPRLTYRMLLGASFLAGSFLVDPSRQLLLAPSCGGSGK